jgi:hypothetical protein
MIKIMTNEKHNAFFFILAKSIKKNVSREVVNEVTVEVGPLIWINSIVRFEAIEVFVRKFDYEQ